jgi:plastocyanin
MSFGKAAVRFLAAFTCWASLGASAGAAQVTGQVSVAATNGAARANRDVSVVFWLTPLAGQAAPRPSAESESTHPKLIQKNKVFNPHVLAVEVGSQVDFPNRDPFFHNVFSLFNGKRFDLGLYEAGSTRAVRFDRVGICYIFCNIHPQMSAVVVVVDTPYFAVSDARGELSIPQVPPGRYQMNFWEEHCSAKSLGELSRQITVGENALSLESIHLQESDEAVTAHLNKYGKQYDPEVFSSPLYVQP